MVLEESTRKQTSGLPEDITSYLNRRERHLQDNAGAGVSVVSMFMGYMLLNHKRLMPMMNFLHRLS